MNTELFDRLHRKIYWQLQQQLRKELIEKLWEPLKETLREPSYQKFNMQCHRHLLDELYEEQ